MVLFTRSLLVAVSFIALVASTPLYKRTFAQVQADVSTILSGTATLSAGVEAFPSSGGTITQALDIQEDAQTLNSDITKATSDVQALGSFTDSEGETIITSFESLKTETITLLQTIVAKESAFANTQAGSLIGVVQQDLVTLNASTVNFAKVLLAAAPSELVKNATAIASAISAQFSITLAAYGST